MSSSINIDIPVLGNPNSTEDPKIRDNFQAIQSWIDDPALSSGDLAENSVTATQIASNAVGTAEIAASAVTTAKIADSTGSTDGVTTAKIATNAVTTEKIASTSITSSKIRLFTIPVVVTELPKQVTTSATCDFSSGVTTISDVNISAGQGAPQVGQLLTGTGIASDTIITAVSGSSTGPYTLTISRATTASGSNVALTYSPQDGDEVYWSAGSGRYWHMRYVSAESTYKWIFVGGAPLVVSGGSLTTFNSTTYADGGSVVDLDVPTTTYTAEWEVTVSALMKCAVNTAMYLSFKIGTASGGWTTPSDSNAAYTQHPLVVSTVSSTTIGRSFHADLNKTSIVTASGSNGYRFRLQHKTSAATDCTWDNREIQIRPVRAY